MKNLAVARRYAKALLLIGQEDGRIGDYRDELDGFARLMTEQPVLEQSIVNPLYESAQRKKVLSAVIDRLALSSVMNRFLLILFEKRRIGFLQQINEHFQKMADELKGIAVANLQSATPLSDEVVEKIRASLSKMTGKDIQLTVEQDPELIGGVVTRIGDLVLDGSIRTQLRNMKESLKRGESA